MSDSNSLVNELSEGRKKFLALIADVRPELHRYCSRMAGSTSDGEDIVQEVLARAYYALSELETLPPLRSWLFRIAHNKAIDHLRKSGRRPEQAIEADELLDSALDPEDSLAQSEAVHIAVSRFLALAPAQRSAVILKDVLEHSLEDIASLLEMSIPAVKAALHRGRSRLHSLPSAPEETPRATSPVLSRYITLFNARDWDAVRGMLADEVRLEVVSRVQRAGRHDVGSYFTRYAGYSGWRLAPAWLDGREVAAVFSAPTSSRPDYFVELVFVEERLVFIRDFRYVPYITSEAELRWSWQ
jgi:RNA polymerase sigma factor (sigma-70 family)